MRLDREFVTKIDKTTVQDRIIQLLGSYGYKQSEKDSLVFKRGFSSLGTMFAFSPKNWGVEATAQIIPISHENMKVMLSLSINTTGQWITDKERAFWINELDSFEKFIHNGQVDSSISGNIAASSETQNILSLIIMWISMLVFFLCFTVAGFVFAPSFTLALIISCLGMPAGIVFGFGINKIWMNYKISGKW